MMGKFKKALGYLLVASMIFSAFSFGSDTFAREVYAKEKTSSGYIEVSGADLFINTYADTESDEAPTDKELESKSSTEETSEELSETTTIPGEEDPTTLADTTTQGQTTMQSQTTAQATTPAATTKASSDTSTSTSGTVKAWGKNSNGKYVNGNKKVIKGATMKGVDVSKWNGKIKWKKVAKSDVDFAIIRAGYGDNEKSQDDEYYARNVKKCEQYAIPYGVYIYSYATTVAQAKSEADHVLRLVSGHTLNFPIYLDMEDSCQEKLSSSKRQKIATAFLSKISAAGYECGIYANLNWWTNLLPQSLARQTELKWVAQYNDNACTYTGTYQMWQCTSQGKVSGIDGNVDLDFWFGEVRDRTYDITKPHEKLAQEVPPKRVTVKSAKRSKKKIVLKWQKVSSAKGYQVQYSTEKKFKKKYRKSQKSSATKTTVKNLSRKTVYYFRVRAYKKGSSGRIYSKKWSKVKKAKTK